MICRQRARGRRRGGAGKTRDGSRELRLRLEDAGASVLAFGLKRDEEWLLLLWLPLQRFLYRQLMYFVAAKSVVVAVKGRTVGWGKLERKATVTG